VVGALTCKTLVWEHVTTLI